MIFKIALKNVLAAGVRTWLNTFILALTFTSIILLQGIYNGMMIQISENRIAEETGHSQIWHKNYDPFDPLSLEESHAEIPPGIDKAISRREAIPVLMIFGSVYPHGQVFPAVLKGIPADQKILALPFNALMKKSPKGTLPGMIGKKMAKSTGLSMGDIITVRWRNSKGAFNATDVSIVHIFNGKVPAMDSGQVWLKLKDLQTMNLSPGHATIVISSKEAGSESLGGQWIQKSLNDLLADTIALVKSKSTGASFLYAILIFLSMIAIFDTQALSIFKRKKEIGTLMALGMTNGAIVRTFTIEGVLYGILASIITLVCGGPLFYFLQTNGITFPAPTEGYGLAMSNHIYPHYSLGLILGTFVIIMIILTIISYLPARKITKLQPFEALRGKIS